MGHHRTSIAGAFLEGTRFCDSTSAPIARTAADVTAGAADDREKAVRLFRWVQDEIQYAILHDWSRTASQTLLQRRGSCSNKANLLCAMLRAQRIPAGFGVLVVHGRKYFGPAWFPALQQRCDERSRHFFATVHLGGRWLRCDPSDDHALSAATSHINPPSARVCFSGTDHADLRLDPAHVLSSTWPVADIDRFLARRTTKPKEDFELLDSAVRFARQHGAACKDLRELEEKFWAWRGPTGSRPAPTGRRPAPGSPCGPG
ncbi:transglutaminase family protein [Streptomyces sp. NPDC049555]|uniref:transglutaminase-like domain-containing protein n=1 Tax=unclassified Streptomyces TaxID=2593676 RepID=UPI0034374401